MISEIFSGISFYDIHSSRIRCVISHFDPSKGFLDINTGENLTYRELLKRTIPDELHGLPMIIHRDASVSNEAPVGINKGNESIISRISAQLGKEITIDEIREAQIFKPDILNSIENGKLEDDEIDILIPSLQSRISGKNPIAGVSYDFGFGPMF